MVFLLSNRFSIIGDGPRGDIGIVAVGGRGYIKTLIAFDEISHIGRAHINGIWRLYFSDFSDRAAICRDIKCFDIGSI